MASLPEKLRKQYGERGIYAGERQFHDYWARDGLFACFGALALKDYDIVRNELDLLLNNLHEGHIPLRIGTISMQRKFLGLPAGQGVRHTQDKGDNESVDGNPLLLILAEKYEHLTLKKLDRNKLHAVQAWLDRHEVEHLLPEGPCSSWEDSLQLTGPRLYTNVLYYRSLIAASKLFKDTKYTARAVQVKLNIKEWWQGQYFTDGPNRDVLMTAGNLLAIMYGIADPKQSRTLLQKLNERKTTCPPAGFFTPKKDEVPSSLRLAGMGDYHAQTVEWSWLGALEVGAYRAVGEEAAAIKREAELRDLFERSGGVCETYEEDKPLKRLFYKTETNFAWTLGILIASQTSGASILR